MPHVAFVPFTGLRICSDELRELGLTLPGLKPRVAALEELPALGLLTLAGMTPEPWQCSYHDGSQDTEKLLDTVLSQQPDLLAVSALTASVNDAYAFCRQVRERGVRTVIGGLHATTCSAEAQLSVDAVAVGDGESVWQEVLSDAAAGELKTLYRADAAFDLSRAPMPRFDLLGVRKPARWTLQTERGCTMACDFCGASRLLGPLREKPLERIQAEVDALCEMSPKPWIELADDSTFVGPRDPEPLLEVLGAAETRYFTEADWRIGERPELLRSLAASGCVQLLVGIESLVFRYPGMGAKQAEMERVLDAVRAIQEAGVAVNGCFIAGAEGETDASLHALTEFILGSPFAEVQVTVQTPFPGTALYHRLKKRGRLLPYRGWSHYTLLDVTYTPDNMSVEQLESGFRRVLAVVHGPAATERRNRIRREVWKRNPRLSKS